MNKDRVVIIVQARMGSQRLPGKVMKQVGDKPLLAYLIDQLKRVERADECVVATSTDPADQVIFSFCRDLGVPCYRGPLDDVLGRYLGAAKQHQAQVIVRICADCPLIDPAIIDRVIGFFLDHSPKYDYVSNCLQRTYPRGQDVEVFLRQALERAEKEAREPEEREHVTPYFYRHPELFRLGSVTGSPDLSHYRWVVDTQEDFAFISNILKTVYPKNPQYGMQDVLKVLTEHPDWIKINAGIQQKTLSS